MTDKLSKEELLKKLNKAFEYLPLSIANGQAHRQIKEMIKKPEVTEEWIEEKATELYNLLYYKTFNRNQVKDFIRLLYREAGCLVE